MKSGWIPRPRTTQLTSTIPKPEKSEHEQFVVVGHVDVILKLVLYGLSRASVVSTDLYSILLEL